MAGEGTIDSLQIEIKSSTAKAVQNLQKLKGALDDVRDSMSQNFGSGLKRSLDSIGTEQEQKINSLAAALRDLKNASGATISKDFSERLTALSGALKSLGSEEINKLKQIASAVKSFEGAKDVNISSVLADRVFDLAAAADTITAQQISNLREFGMAVKEGLGSIEASFTEKIRDVGNALQYFTNIKTDSIDKSLPGRLVELGTAVRMFNENDIEALGSLARSLSGMSGVRSISENVPSRLQAILDVAFKVDEGTLDRLDRLASSLQKLNGLDLSGFKSSLSGLGGISGLFSADGLKESVKGLKDSVDSAKKLYKIVNSFSRIAFYRLIRSAVKAVTDALKEGTENAYNFSKAFETHEAGTRKIAEVYDNLATTSFKMTNQLGAAWASFVREIEPMLISFLNIVTAVTNTLTQLFSAMAGRDTYLKAIEYNKEWGDSAAKAGKAAKEWKNQLLGFDEINRLEAPADTTRGGSGIETPDLEKMFENAAIDSKIKEIGDKFAEVKKMVQNHLKEIELVAANAVLGIGLALFLTGANIPLGLGLMAVGAVALAAAIAPNWDEIKEKVGGTLNAMILIASGLTFGIGLALALSGASLPLGLGLMVAGATMFGAAAALNWDDMPAKIKEAIGKITLAVGAASLAIGMVMLLAAPEFSPLGLALVAAGVAGLTAGVAINWGSMKKNVGNALAGITAVLGGAILGVGAVLLFSGASLPLGIGLMAAGAVTLGAAVALNWEQIQTFIREKTDAIALILGGSLLAIGAILAFSGVNLPLGIGLMAGGAVTLGAAAALNWDEIVTNLQGRIGLITEAVGTALIAIGAILTFTGANIPLGIGMMIAGGIGAGSVIAANWEIIQEKLSGTLGAVMTIAGGFLAAIGLVLLFTGNIPLGIGLLVAGSSAFGVGAANVDWDSVGKTIKEKLEGIHTYVSEKLPQIKDTISKKWSEIKTDTANKWEEIRKKVKGKIEGINPDINPKIEELKRKLSGAWEEIKTNATTLWDEIKKKISGNTEEIDTEATTNATNTQIAVTREYETAKANSVSAFETIKREASRIWGNIQSEVSQKVELTKNSVSTAINNMKESVTGDSSTMNDRVQEKIRAMKETVVTDFENMKSTVGTKAEGILTGVTQTFGNIKQKVTDSLSTAKDNAVRDFNNMKDTLSTSTQNILGTVTNAFDNIKNQISSSLDFAESDVSSKFNMIENDVSNSVYDLQNLMNFQWSLPAPSIPHFNWNWLTVTDDMSVPNIWVEWYAQGGVFDKPSVIGVGEAGKEAVVPLAKNAEWIGSVASQIRNAGGIESDGTADAVSESGDEIVNAILSSTVQIISAMRENSGGSVDFDGFVKNITKVQRRQARAAGVA